MNIARQNESIPSKSFFRTHAFKVSNDCAQLASIFQKQTSLCIWTPPRSRVIEDYAKKVAEDDFHFKKIIPVGDIEESLRDFPNSVGRKETLKWMTTLIEIFATLFELAQVGVRIEGRKSPMCPRLHVDHIPLRLIHTLYGESSDLLIEPEYYKTQRSEENIKKWINSGEDNANLIQRAPKGSVVIMKGTRWNKETHPIIHRSPKHTQARLVLTLDVV